MGFMPPVDEPPLFPEIEFAELAPASTIELPPATDSGRDFHDRARARAMTPLAATGLGLVATGALLSAVGSGTLGGNTLLELGLAPNDSITIDASRRECWTLVATGSALVLGGGLTLHFSRDAIGLR